MLLAHENFLPPPSPIVNVLNGDGGQLDPISVAFVLTVDRRRPQLRIMTPRERKWMWKQHWLREIVGEII